ncbi:MAG: DHHA1 domain-containing protein [bacterium]|nr:DHHA1 domain-containing protein [bacterium]MDZ4284583.1 DHHA1 domain-containing protein [Patescibacteria group bacterium]
MHHPHTIGLYHKDCTDGTAAAAVLLKKFPHIELHPVGHDISHSELENLLGRVSADTEVYTVDIAVGVQELLAHAKSVVTIDHHIGIKETLEQLAREHENFTFVFDNERSGASLAWHHFFPEKPVTELITLVEDNDLWRFSFGQRTRHLLMHLSTLMNQPKRVLELLGGNLEPFIAAGEHMTRYADTLISHFAEGRDPTWLRVGEHRVPGYNSPYFESELGHALSKKHDSAVAIFRFKGAVVNFSVRSADGQNPSALDLATLLGGGGHRNASGASVPIEKFVAMLELP